jgi:hypothetical protein
VSDCVADTHALYWYLTARPTLGDNARAAFSAAEQASFASLILRRLRSCSSMRSQRFQKCMIESLSE